MCESAKPSAITGTTAPIDFAADNLKRAYGVVHADLRRASCNEGLVPRLGTERSRAVAIINALEAD